MNANAGVLLLYAILNSISECGSSSSQKECKRIVHNDFTKCGSDSSFELSENPPGRYRTSRQAGGQPGKNMQSPTCMVDDICNKTFRMTAIDLLPFSVFIQKQIGQMLSECCGDCAYPQIVNRLKDVSFLNDSILSITDITFPVFGRSTQNHLHGYWFIPLIDIPSAYYVRSKLTKEKMIADMLTGLFDLWPLLVICLLFSGSAGIIIWVLETWRNYEEFPRPFFVGSFEGFWWSFISMTTVGYGDKAPRSRIARCFSIGWILIGITMFSILTASLTNIITAAETPSIPNIAGQKVAALKNRIYDATVIAKHGGMLQAIEHDNVTNGIDKLIDMLSNTSSSLAGFLLDRQTYFFYCRETRGCDRMAETVRTEKFLREERHSYGMLVRDEDDYHYFNKYIESNWFAFDTCLNLLLNNMSEKFVDKSPTGLFSPDNGLFLPVLYGFVIAVAVSMFLGFLFEFWRKKNHYNQNIRKTKDVAMT